MSEEVKAWEEDIIIPTYPTGSPEKSPMFPEKRIYQGSSGVVYPHAIIEKIYDEKTDKTYKAVFLENRYLKVMILPELGAKVPLIRLVIRVVRLCWDRLIWKITMKLI